MRCSASQWDSQRPCLDGGRRRAYRWTRESDREAVRKDACHEQEADECSLARLAAALDLGGGVVGEETSLADLMEAGALTEVWPAATFFRAIWHRQIP